MSGKRYFYTDALEAAWMSKHFGMRFVHLPEGLSEEVEVMGRTCRYSRIPLQPEYRIHAESLPLLEPQSGDLFRLYQGFVDYRTIRPEDHDFNLIKALLEDGRGAIVQRGDKAFHWPQSEAA